MTSADLHRLAVKFCDECELTRDITTESAITYRMFLSRFLAWIDRRRREERMFAEKRDDNVLQFDLRREGGDGADIR